MLTSKRLSLKETALRTVTGQDAFTGVEQDRAVVASCNVLPQNGDVFLALSTPVLGEINTSES